MSSYLLMNINDLGAFLKFKVFDFCPCFYFTKYCKEIAGVSSYINNINELGSMAVSSQV